MWRFAKHVEAGLVPAGIASLSRGRWLVSRILVVTTLLVALLHAANGVFVYHFYSTTAAREAEAREATATLLAEQASHTLTAIDLTMETVAAKLQARLNGGPLTMADQALLKEESGRVPHVGALLVLDRRGRVALDSARYPPVPRNLADESYFTALATPGATGPFIGHRAFGPNASPYFSMSRPIFGPQNRRIGAVVAIVDPSYFAALPGTLSNAAAAAYLARKDDDTILAGETGAGGSVPATARALLAQHAGGVTSIRDIAGFPLRMIVAGPPPGAAPAFRNFVVFDVMVMAVVTVVALWLAWRLTNEERARSAAEDRLRDAIESTPGGFALYDGGDRLVLCNRTYVEYYTPAVQPLVVPGARFETIVRLVAEGGGWAEGTDEKSQLALVERRLAAHREAATELVQHLRDGRWLLTRERRTKDGGIACFYTEITRLKQQEEALRRSEQLEREARETAERADRAKSAFLATMSHELRTPLNAVIGFSQIIEQGMFGPQPARYREYATLIRRSGEHLLTIINDILDIAKLQSGKTELRLESAALAPIVDEAVRLVAPRAEAAGLTLVQDIAADMPPVRVDLTRIRQVLLNLLSNAIKFTPADGTVTITARPGAGAVEIAVGDTGIGMAAADIPKALEPFGQIANAMTRAHEGTGLGLPLSKSLVELHGGQFSIKSAPGQGTTVTVTLPVDEAAPARALRGVG
ncbi:MAG: PAS-domain containing protein [Alphaproteobacteria bacterium]|nr:PAS-domain containing protein [Alphaproteobacteria bacterium]